MKNINFKIRRSKVTDYAALNVANMSFNAFPENKILAKISEFTVLNITHQISH